MTALLEAQSLSRRFGGIIALDGVDVQVKAGEVLGLIGPNGSGKTTFFNVVTGIFAPHGGTVRFDGEDLTAASAQTVYGKGIARTFQRSRLCLDLSVFENVVLGNGKHLDTRIFHALFRRRRLAREMDAQLAQVRALLERFDPELARAPLQPTAGLPMIQRRRIEVCRALMARPRLLLLDEPSAGMTHEETRRLMDDILAIRAEMGDLAIVIVEHDMATIERVTDRCVVFNFGRKVCEGPYRAVVADPMVQRAYLGEE
ncbi:ABC transporter ATP-binding protein [Xanthobacter flavus]|uniref:ABC transporter ATP-binding protein n=1 Tax=Xanthobacter flavus TaxID=281 RepID=UPI001AE59A90|nr:ABC transporter ATP-binding protein [Xanthobacter flavus]MBP2150859.1 ABC-type branched-subunit amino acid transport system ATPase component [Xanthobacter flavus]